MTNKQKPTTSEVIEALGASIHKMDVKPAEKFADSEIIVIGNNNRYGIGQTLNQARKNASNPGQWAAYIIAEGTTVSECDAAFSWKRGNAPRLIAHSAGHKPSALKNPGLLVRAGGEEGEQ